MTILKSTLLLGAIVAMATVATLAQASPIIWAGGTNISTQIVDKDDHNTNGTQVWGLDFAGTGQTVTTTNGPVPYAAAPVVPADVGDPDIGQTWGNVHLFASPAGTWSHFLDQLSTETTNDADYDALLNPAMFGGTNDVLTISGLVSGLEYELQLFSNDSRGITEIGGRTTTVKEGAGPLATILQNMGAVTNDGSLGSHITGAFTSDGSDVAITLNSHESSWLLNAAQLRVVGGTPDIPEPTALVLGLISILGLMATRRRVS